MYNIEAFKEEAEKSGHSAWNINGDAFSDEVKAKALSLIAEHMGTVDLVVYSIAAPRRIDPETGQIYSSALKPIGKPFTSKMMDMQSGEVSEITAEPATSEEIEHTVKVMGGEDWMKWIEALDAEKALSLSSVTVAFSYIGPSITAPIYREGTIGRAKEDLEQTSGIISQKSNSVRRSSPCLLRKEAKVTRLSTIVLAVSTVEASCSSCSRCSVGM